MRKNSKGFTTVELLIAISMIAIIVPSIIGLITTINKLNDKAADLNRVNSLAENKVESIRSMGFTGLANGTTDFTNELPQGLGKPKSATYTVSTPTINGQQPDNLRQVDMVISFTDQGRMQTINYKTFVGEVGVGQY